MTLEIEIPENLEWLFEQLAAARDQTLKDWIVTAVCSPALADIDDLEDEDEERTRPITKRLKESLGFSATGGRFEHVEAFGRAMVRAQRKTK